MKPRKPKRDLEKLYEVTFADGRALRIFASAKTDAVRSAVNSPDRGRGEVVNVEVCGESATGCPADDGNMP